MRPPRRLKWPYRFRACRELAEEMREQGFSEWEIDAVVSVSALWMALIGDVVFFVVALAYLEVVPSWFNT